MWNTRGFHVVNQSPSDTKVDNDYLATNVLAALREEFIPRDRARHPKPLVVHMDNCSIHTSGATQRFMSEHQMSGMPQPPYCPDLAPSDFYLFTTMEDRLDKIHMVDGDDFFEQLSEILQEIPIDESERVFTAWNDRFREVSEANGDYIAE
jgi:histone-lysine N-methyltransferase SETMAR